MTCSEKKAPLTVAVATAPYTVKELHDELQAADHIITAMLQHLTISQKQHINFQLEERSIITDGMTRHHERQHVLLRAREHLAKGGAA
jgi:hypothetical protein